MENENNGWSDYDYEYQFPEDEEEYPIKNDPYII